MSTYRRLSPYYAAVTRTREDTDDGTKLAWTLEVMFRSEVVFTEDFSLTESGRLDAISVGNRMVRAHRIEFLGSCAFPLEQGSCTRDAVTADLRCQEHHSLSVADAHRAIAIEYVNVLNASYQRENVAIHSAQRRHDRDVVITTGTIASLIKQIDDLTVDLHIERTGDCMACRGTGVADPSERRCSYCNGRGYIEPPVVAENRKLRQTLRAIAVVTPQLPPTSPDAAFRATNAVRQVLYNSDLFPERPHAPVPTVAGKF